ncbi:TetR/AcrR family transcriptional regulator [Breznakia sp. PH1-1]|nr:TetR/AcrR family transcriptional regulator [Breznakia sp. PH1-1]MDH6404109.1 TetR/AcrR family transcriptional regulator [Breznakia sp. PF1-11]MDH6411818.1 TetR/AcrR family transcriptional regulator [Breznakia sp. PFB1-11]MDH6414097.1 TetR/AcrR family transcriptional regulator [Breznakia sp. PFB1-14]MDH6416546.1 TetR/AcrR family transcriptional regulator [Breznakia sp. PFB1-4]MDH6418869.1 TetR/AcrR family transcriptional regulator [Breznakia sp. PFB1-12]MDH6473900.1 TetR/AcrR family transcr
MYTMNMKDTLDKIEKSKQIPLMNAIIKEFANHGYQKASTNQMVKDAGISKGLLFHYFGNKKNMFEVAFVYVIRIVMDGLQESNYLDISDIFEFILHSMHTKVKVMKKHPDSYSFLLRVYNDNDPFVKDIIVKYKNEMVDEAWSSLIERADTYKFKDPNDIPLLLELITYASYGYIETNQKLLQDDIDAVIKNFEAYFIMLRKRFYKDEYL